MVAGVLDELAADRPRNRFTVGIDDDVSGIPASTGTRPSTSSPPDTVRAVFFGLGSDGTVGANKNTIKIIGDEPDLHAQGYFVYDSKKSGSQTVSHLRFGPRSDPRPLPGDASAVSWAATSRGSWTRPTSSTTPRPGAALLLNSRHGPDRCGTPCPGSVQQQILDKDIEFYVVDADRIAQDTGLAGRINTILQTCFFAISGVLPRDEAIDRSRRPVAKTYARQGEDVVARKWPPSTTRWRAAPGRGRRTASTSDREAAAVVPADAPEFVRTVTARDDRRARRRAAGQRAARRRHVPQRHRRLREAQHLRAGRGVGSRHLHPVRQLQLRLPAQRHPLQAATTPTCSPAPPPTSRRRR